MHKWVSPGHADCVTNPAKHDCALTRRRWEVPIMCAGAVPAPRCPVARNPTTGHEGHREERPYGLVGATCCFSTGESWAGCRLRSTVATPRPEALLTIRAEFRFPGP